MSKPDIRFRTFLKHLAKMIYEGMKYIIIDKWIRLFLIGYSFIILGLIFLNPIFLISIPILIIYGMYLLWVDQQIKR